APDWRRDPDSTRTRASDFGSAFAGPAENTAPDSGACDGMATVVAQGRPKRPPAAAEKLFCRTEETRCAQALLALGRPNDPKTLLNDDSKVIFYSRDENQFNHEIVLGKILESSTPLNALFPATLTDLEELFPRDRFLALDIETTGPSAATDGLRTVQLSD